MAQVFEDKDMKGEELSIHEDPLHDVKGQIESGVGTIRNEPLFEGASGSEKLPETRVGETLLTDNVQKLDSKGSAVSMDTEEATPEDRVVKSDVAETFASEYKEDHGGSIDMKGQTVSSDDADAGKSEFSGDDSQGNQEQSSGTKFKKLNTAHIPRGKPHFRISANHGNRNLGDTSLQSGGSGGGLGGSGLRGGPRGGLARTGSGLARTGSGIPQGNNDLKDFAAALSEGDKQSSESSLPTSTDAKSLPEEKQSDSTMSEKAAETKDSAAGKLSTAKDMVAEKSSAAKVVIMEKAGDLKTVVMATLKDQLLPVKDSDLNTSDMEVGEST